MEEEMNKRNDSEDLERAISASQFDKLNSFSTTLIRVLSQLFVLSLSHLFLSVSLILLL
jgi:hypothetical protein